MSPRYKLYAAIIPSLSKLPSVKHYSIPTMFLPSHACDVDAEPLHRFTGTGLVAITRFYWATCSRTKGTELFKRLDGVVIQLLG